jgi:hypothetical protein
MKGGNEIGKRKRVSKQTHKDKHQNRAIEELTGLIMKGFHTK